MKQVITQHGWGFDQSFWNIDKVEFQKNNWYWRDNERGYFSKEPHQSEWLYNNSNNKIKMIICHSLGFHLIKENILKEASHIVLINSFNNFLPLSEKRNLILRSLKRMEKKIKNFETKIILQEFIKRSFLPNFLNIEMKKIYNQNFESIKNTLLLSDLKKLYEEKNPPNLLKKNCNIIFIQSDKDLILDQDSSNSFFELLNQKLDKKPTLLKLYNQGHCLSNLNLYELINNNLEN